MRLAKTLLLSALCGTEVLFIACGGGGGGSVGPTQPVPTVNINASQQSIALGQSATLTWSSTNANSCTASASPAESDWSGSVATSGSQSVTPPALGTPTFTLACTGSGGSASSSTSVKVTVPAPTVTVSVSPSSINLGQSVTLTWSSTNANSCTASGDWSGSEPTSGTQSLTPTAAGTPTYTLTCTGSGGSASGSASLTVITRPPPSGTWQRTGPTGGSITVLAEDPSNPSTIYASTSAGGAGGIWRSSDSGVTWEPLITNSSADFSCSSDIAVVNAGQVVYAPSCGPYFLESKDGGTTWTQAQAAPNGVDIKAMVVDPKNDSTIYLSAPGVGVLKSQDGGQTWDALPSSPVITTPSGTAVLHNALCIDQQDTVYYGTDHGLFLTRDGGTTWLQSISGFAVSDVAFRDLAVGPTGVFALAGIESSTVTDLYETTDGGNSWTALATGLDAERVVPDPNNSSTIYLSGLQYHVVYKSTDGGVTFQPSDSGIPFSSSGGGSGYIMLTGPTGTIIPLISSPNTFLVGSLVLGVFKTQDAAQSWESSNTGISAFAGLDVAVDPQTPTTVYLAAANGGGIFKSTDSGVTWVNLVQNSAFAIAVDPFDSDHLLAHVGGEGLAESHDGGSTWQTVTSGLPTPPSGGTPWIVGIRFDPTQKGTIYVSTSGGGVAVLKSTDGGTTYAISNSGLNTGESGWDDSLSPVAIDSVDSAVLFLSTSIGLFKSSDAGASWVLKKPLSSPQSVVTISIDERVTPHAVYAAGFSVFLKSADFGETWQPVPVPSDLSSWLYSVVVDPGWAESVFLISGGYPAQAAAWSPDGGVSWTPLAGGLGQPLLTYNGSGLAIAPSEPEVLFVVSFNNSVLRFVIGP